MFGENRGEIAGDNVTKGVQKERGTTERSSAGSDRISLSVLAVLELTASAVTGRHCNVIH
jgi:hypothetical protein